MAFVYLLRCKEFDDCMNYEKTNGSTFDSYFPGTIVQTIAQEQVVQIILKPKTLFVPFLLLIEFSKLC
jgi:hypothetical protein